MKPQEYIRCEDGWVYNTKYSILSIIVINLISITFLDFPRSRRGHVLVARARIYLQPTNGRC